MTLTDRPDCIVHWTQIEGADDNRYDGHDELLAIDARFGRHFGLKRLGINHQRLPPGRRTSFPHAESVEEEFVYVIEGTPDVWLDGHLHRLAPGDGVGFPPGTGLSHSFLNNTDTEVRLLIVGDTRKEENRVFYPRNPEQQTARDDGWNDVPSRSMGGHDGLPDRVRVARSKPRET